MGVAMMTAANTQTMGYPGSGANGMDSVTGRKVRQEKTFIEAAFHSDGGFVIRIGDAEQQQARSRRAPWRNRT